MENKEPSLASKETVSELTKTLATLAKSIGYPTIVTALFYYLGLARVRAIYAYFGIDYSILDFSVQDYILQSVVSSFEPVRWILILGLLGIWFNYWISKTMGQSAENQSNGKDQQSAKKKVPIVQRLLYSVVVVGVLSLLAGPVLILSGLKFHPFLIPTTWMVGIGCLNYGFYLGVKIQENLAKQKDEKSWITNIPGSILKNSSTLLMILLIFSAFWFVSYYARVIGEWEAAYKIQNLVDVPCVELYSQTPLELLGPDIVSERISTTENAYQYHYQGLRFLLYSADKYFLLPLNWSEENPRAIIIDDTENIRVEVAPGYFCSR